MKHSIENAQQATQRADFGQSATVVPSQDENDARAAVAPVLAMPTRGSVRYRVTMSYAEAGNAQVDTLVPNGDLIDVMNAFRTFNSTEGVSFLVVSKDE